MNKYVIDEGRNGRKKRSKSVREGESERKERGR